MGRKTFEAFAGDPLPGRFNIVITRQANWQAGNPAIEVAPGLEQAIDLAKKTDCKEAFIIGGGQVYAAAISLANKIYLTRVHATLEGDAFFPEIDSS
jgi:dihydrofolate reductase